MLIIMVRIRVSIFYALYWYSQISGGLFMSRRGDNIHKRRDGRWEGRYISGREPDGRAKNSSVYAGSFRECSEKLKLARCGLLPKAKPITVAELFSEWLLNRKNTVKLSSYVCYRNMYYTYIDGALGECRINTINSLVLNRFADELLHIAGSNGQGLSPRTVQAVIILLRSILRYAEEEYGMENAARNISFPKAARSGISLFNQFEISRIKHEALKGNGFELGVLLGLYAGLRIVEICALTLGDIDLSEQLVHIRKTMFRIRNPDGGSPKTILITDTPKSASSVRSVPIPPFMLGALARLKRGRSDDYYLLSCSAVPIEPRTYTERYRTFLKRLDIPYRKFHSLRHTFATECIKSGVDVKSLSELLGHSSVKITVNTPKGHTPPTAAIFDITIKIQQFVKRW